MKQHLYRITVERLTDTKGNAVNDAPIIFEVGNHDNIAEIIAILENTTQFAPNASHSQQKAFAVGLKLFSEILLENRTHPLFIEFRPHFNDFMKKLKNQA